MGPLLDQEKMGTAVDGEIISSNEFYAVVRVSDDTVTEQAKGTSAAAAEEDTEEDRVELAQALFGSKPEMVQNPNGGLNGK